MPIWGWIVLGVVALVVLLLILLEGSPFSGPTEEMRPTRSDMECPVLGAKRARGLAIGQAG